MSSFWRRFPALLMARRNLSRNRLRSALAALGIIIGVLAVASLGILGNVLQLSATNELGGLGTQVIVSPAAEAGVEGFSARDVRQVQRIAEERGGTAVPLVTGGGVVRAAGGRQTVAQFYTVERPAALFSADEGAVPQRQRQGALVGADVADRLGVRVGSSLDVQGDSYRVIAVLAPSETISPVQPDNAVVLPPGALGDGPPSQVVIRTDSGEAASAIAEEVRSRLNARERRVSVFELSSILDAIGEFFALLNGFLIGLASISLVVAGVSIFNVMLMSTNERRQEIGVLRAVGVEKRDVLRTLVVEATLLGVAGGAVGTALSAALAGGLYWFTPVSLEVVTDPSNGVFLVGAFAFGVVVSLLSGLYPAWKAASERPVDALRS